jgi:hypothetical protein
MNTSVKHHRVIDNYCSWHEYHDGITVLGTDMACLTLVVLF